MTRPYIIGAARYCEDAFVSNNISLILVKIFNGTNGKYNAVIGHFFQTAVNVSRKIKADGNRFVHYTSADTAYKIIHNKELWLRNAAVMNDFSEVSYGLECLKAARASVAGHALTNALNAIDPSIITEADDLFWKWLPFFQSDTFLTSFAVHEDDEDDIGRLSMWRAYGNVAIVFKNDAFVNPGPNPIEGVTVSPVSYFNAKEAGDALFQMAAAIEHNASGFRTIPKGLLVSNLFRAMRFSILANKHPGFREEREWRIIHSPSHDASPMPRQLVTVNGVPQHICKFKWPGLNGDKQFIENIDRIIIGPAEHAWVMRNAFHDLLASNGISDAAQRVAVSNIPLRR